MATGYPQGVLQLVFGLVEPAFLLVDGLGKLGHPFHQFPGSQVAVNLVRVPVPPVGVVVYHLNIDRGHTQVVGCEVVGDLKIESDVVLKVGQVDPGILDAVRDLQGGFGGTGLTTPGDDPSDDHRKAQGRTDSEESVHLQVGVHVQDVEGHDGSHGMGDQEDAIFLVSLQDCRQLVPDFFPSRIGCVLGSFFGGVIGIQILEVAPDEIVGDRLVVDAEIIIQQDPAEFAFQERNNPFSQAAGTGWDGPHAGHIRFFDEERAVVVGNLGVQRYRMQGVGPVNQLEFKILQVDLPAFGAFADGLDPPGAQDMLGWFLTQSMNSDHDVLHQLSL